MTLFCARTTLQLKRYSMMLTKLFSAKYWKTNSILSTHFYVCAQTSMATNESGGQHLWKWFEICSKQQTTVVNTGIKLMYATIAYVQYAQQRSQRGFVQHAWCASDSHTIWLPKPYKMCFDWLTDWQQESRAVARQPRDAATVLFGLKFAADITSLRVGKLRKPGFRAPNIPAQNRI